MTGEGLLTVELETIQRRVDDDLVVHGLAAEPFQIGRQRHGWHRVHGRVGDVLHVHRNVPVRSSTFPKVCYWISSPTCSFN